MNRPSNGEHRGSAGLRLDPIRPIATEAILVTRRMRLRRIKTSDAVALHELYGDPLAMQYMPSGPSASLNDTKERLGTLMRLEASAGVGLYAVELQHGGSCIGVAGIFPYELTGPEWEMGFAFTRSVWGHGYATEVAHSVLGWAFKNPDIDCRAVWAVSYTGNVASAHVLMRIGMHDFGSVQHRRRHGSLFGIDSAGKKPSEPPKGAAVSLDKRHPGEKTSP